jgi:hypothetical protein
MATTPRSEYEQLRERATEARQQAESLRDLREIATCGLHMEYQHWHNHDRENRVNYGTYRVPAHIALRVADQYLVWAHEYDEIARAIEGQMEALFVEGHHV